MFISTKLQAPPPSIKLVLRSSLLDRLTTGKDRRLLVISGIAGSGKTSLVSKWVAEDKLSAAWYSLDEIDDDFDVFFRYVLTTLSAIEPELASAVEPWLQDQRSFSRSESLPVIVELLAGLHKDVYLVLDDYQHIVSSEIHLALVYLLNHMPPKMHIVIITRYSLPFSLSFQSPKSGSGDYSRGYEIHRKRDRAVLYGNYASQTIR